MKMKHPNQKARKREKWLRTLEKRERARQMQCENEKAKAKRAKEEADAEAKKAEDDRPFRTTFSPYFGEEELDELCALGEDERNHEIKEYFLEIITEEIEDYFSEGVDYTKPDFASFKIRLRFDHLKLLTKPERLSILREAAVMVFCGGKFIVHDLGEEEELEIDWWDFMEDDEKECFRQWEKEREGSNEP